MDFKLPTRLGPVSWPGQEAVGELWRWWVAGLLLCAPKSLKDRIEEKACRIVVEVGQGGCVLFHEAGAVRRQLGEIEEGEFHNAGELVKNFSRKCPELVIRIDDRKVLLKSVVLPLSVEENLGQVLGFEMDRVTPFKTDDIYYDFRVLERHPTQQKLTAELAVTRREQLDLWLQRFDQAGLVPSVVESSGTWPGANLLPAEMRPRKSRVSSRINLGLAILVVALFVGALVFPLWQKHGLADALGEQVRTARQEAAKITGLREELDKRIQSARYVVTKRQNTLPVVDVLRELTRLLPDDTWVQQLDVRNGSIEIRGESKQATALIGYFEGSPLFEKPVFRSPVVQVAGQGKERFHLSAKLAEGGGE